MSFLHLKNGTKRNTVRNGHPGCSKAMSDKTPQHLINVMSERWNKKDMVSSMFLQQRLLAIRVNSGSSVQKVVEDLLNRVSRLRYELSAVGEDYPDRTVSSLVLNAL